MKLVKIFLGLCWICSAFIAGFGVIIYFSNPIVQFNYTLFNPVLLIFIMTFSVCTPIFSFIYFGDALTKNQKELDEEKKRLYEMKVEYEKAKYKLIDVALNLENETSKKQIN